MYLSSRLGNYGGLSRFHGLGEEAPAPVTEMTAPSVETTPEPSLSPISEPAVAPTVEPAPASTLTPVPSVSSPTPAPSAADYYEGSGPLDYSGDPVDMVTGESGGSGFRKRRRRHRRHHRDTPVYVDYGYPSYNPYGPYGPPPPDYGFRRPYSPPQPPRIIVAPSKAKRGGFPISIATVAVSLVAGYLLFAK